MAIPFFGKSNKVKPVDIPINQKLSCYEPGPFRRQMCLIHMDNPTARYDDARCKGCSQVSTLETDI